MTKKEEQELLEYADVAYKAFAIVLRTANPIEQDFILSNRDMFLSIFNRSVLTIQKLLTQEKGE